MFYRNFASFICLSVAAAIATVHNNTHSSTASDLEATVYQLTTENPESSTRGPDQPVTESTAVDLGALLDAGDGAVVTLVTGDTRLAAHKAVVTARSPVFASTLQRMMLEGSTGEVAIPDVEGPVLRQMLAYMYTLQAPQLPSMASQLLVAADTYGLSALKAHCEQQVAAQLSVETAVTAALLAVRHSCSSLTQAAVAFIRTHIRHVMTTQGWKDALNSQPEDLVKVIRLLSDPPAEASVPAAGGSGAAPTTQPHSDHSGHCCQTRASAAPPTTALSTSPSDDAISRMSTPAPGEGRTTPATEPPSDHSDNGQTPASAGQTTAAGHTAPTDDAAVSLLQSLYADEKNRKLRIAAMNGAVQEVEALLAAGADVGAADEDRWTALHFAAIRGHVEVARCLLAAGAAVEARDRLWQWTPLHAAAVRGHAAVVRLLVEEASADVNARNVDGRTPLHYAAYSGRAGMAAVLLQAGADKVAADNRGRTPLDVARQYSHQQLVDMLTA